MTLLVDSLTFEYAGRPVLSDVSFRIEPGEIVAVLGQNGAGKSTLFRCLCGILRPNRGSVYLQEKNILSYSVETRAQKIAYVPQRLETTPISVFYAILLGRKPYFTWFAARDDYRKVEKTIEELHLNSLAKRSLDTLSGGEIQKVALARALVQEPDILVFDEPISALDLRNQVSLMTLLQDIVRERNIMLLLSLHDINMAIRYADRFIMLRSGKIIGDLKADDLTPDMIEKVYDLPVDIHKSSHNISFVIERLNV